MNDTGLLGSSSNADGHNQRQEHLKPRRQIATDPRGKVINGSLIGSAPSLKSQDERVNSYYSSHDEETQHNDCKRSAEDTEPSDTR